MKTSPKLRAWLYLGATFLLGVVAGFFLGAVLTRPPSPPKAEEILAHLTSDLQLTGAQVRAIDPIVRDLVREMHSEHERAIKRMVEVIVRSHERMEPFLEPEQVKKLRRITQDRVEDLLRKPRGGK